MSRSGVGRVGAGSRPVRGSERAVKASNPTEVFFQDEDNVEAFLDWVADCGSVREFCRVHGLNQMHFMRLVENDATVAEWWTTARSVRAFNVADEVMILMERMKAGEMTAQEFTAACKALQWDASKNHRDVFGDGPRQTGGVSIDLRGALIDARGRVSEALDGSPGEVVQERLTRADTVVRLDEGGRVFEVLDADDGEVI